MKKITGVKAFKKGLICKGFQFEENKEFVHEGELKICKSGFHFCENPLDVLNYYDLCDSEFAEVEAKGDVLSHNDDSKKAANKLKIGLKIDLKKFIELSFEYVWNKCKKTDASSGDSSQLVASGDYSQLASSGYSSKLASSGNSSQLVASGNYSQLASSGDSSQLASSGCSSKLAASGYSSKLAASGDSSKLAASGNYSQLASSGNYSQLASGGNSSKLAASGDSSQLVASGYSSQLASSGNYSQLASSGYSSQLASSGDSSQLASSGDSSKLAASGDSSQLVASGNSSQLEISGKNSVGANIGINGRIKGCKGTWITLAEYDDNYNCICVKSAKIDGEKIKADTWYILKNKKFTEI